MSQIPLKYHTDIKFYTQYTHPTLICRGTDGRTENIYSIFGDKLLLLGEHVFRPQDPVANNDTLAPNLDAKYLILRETASSPPLGHPDGGRDAAVFY